MLEILQLPLLGQVSSPRVRPHFPICDLCFVIEVEHIREHLIPAFPRFDPRKSCTPLNIDFTGLHIDHVREILHILVGQVFSDNVEVLGWLCECATQERCEAG